MRALSKFELDFLLVSSQHAIENETNPETLEALKRFQNCFNPDVRFNSSSDEFAERLWRCSNAKVFRAKHVDGFIGLMFDETIKAMYRELRNYA